MDNWFQKRLPKLFGWKRTVFSVNDAGTTRYPHAKEWIWTPISHHIEKFTQNGLVLYIRDKTIQLLEENTGINLRDLGLGNGFLDMTPRCKQQRKTSDNLPVTYYCKDIISNI